MNRLPWQFRAALAVMLVVGISGQFLPHHLPNWYRLLVLAVAFLIFLALSDRPRSSD